MTWRGFYVQALMFDGVEYGLMRMMIFAQSPEDALRCGSVLATCERKTRG